MIKTILWVGFGGALGSAFRYLSTVWISKLFAHTFPLATFIINVVGCLLIGLIAGIFERQLFSSKELQYFLISGFCGGFTTFSAFAYENFNLITNQPITAVLYTASSVFVGIIAVWLGLYFSQII